MFHLFVFFFVAGVGLFRIRRVVSSHAFTFSFSFLFLFLFLLLLLLLLLRGVPFHSSGEVSNGEQSIRASIISSLDNKKQIRRRIIVGPSMNFNEISSPKKKKRTRRRSPHTHTHTQSHGCIIDERAIKEWKTPKQKWTPISGRFSHS